MGRRQLIMFLSIVLFADALLVAAVVGATTQRPDYGAIAFIGALALPWLLIVIIMWALLRFVRWSEFARLYPADDHDALESRQPKIVNLRMRSKGMRFNNGMEAATDERGLYLRPVFPCPGGVPLRIPWKAMTPSEEPGITMLGERLTRLDTEIVPLWLPTKLIEGHLDMMAGADDAAM
ncbi:MAG: hypothetical protein AAFX05_09790 [Planctomycetota bacterium]